MNVMATAGNLLRARSVRLGVAVALSALALLWVTLRVGAQPTSIPMGGAGDLEITQDAALLLTATVGVDPTVCAITPTVTVRANTPVYLCYTIHNSGTAALTLHTVESARLVITATLPLTLPAGGVTNTVGLGLVITDSSAVDVTDTVTWTAQTADGATIVVTGLTRIDVAAPAVSLVKTVGQDSANCPVTTALNVTAGQTAAYCLTLENRGDITLTRHTLVDAPLGLSGSFAFTLAPGEKLAITPTTWSNFGLTGALERAVNGAFTNTAVYTASTATGLTTTATASARVDVGNATALLLKTVGTDPVACPESTSLVAPPGSRLYYCVTIRNTGGLTLTHHVLSEPALAIDLAFDYEIAPGGQLTLTNRVLTETLGLLALFGPFQFDTVYPTVVNNTMTYVGTAANGTQVQSAAGTSATFPPTPTPTATNAPRPTSTPVPFPTSTPIDTPIPPTPTETPTPTWTPITPTPTPTRSFAISELATPTPPAPTPVAESPLDPALIAQAATATAAAAAFLESPLATPGPEAVILEQAPPTETPAQEPTPTATPTRPPTITPTPTSEVVYIIVTESPDAAPTPTLPAPTATPTPDYLLLAAKTFDMAVAAAGWIWFLIGSLVFFVTAGIVAGLFFRQQEHRRFDLLLTDDEFPLEPDPYSGLGDDEDDAWPSNLP